MNLYVIIHNHVQGSSLNDAGIIPDFEIFVNVSFFENVKEAGGFSPALC